MHPSGPPPQGYSAPPPGGGYPPGMPGPGPQGPGPHAPQAPRQPIPHQNLAIGILVCALLILIACFSKSWMTWKEGGSESGGFGLSGAEFCARGGYCAPVSNELLEKRPGMPSDVSIWGMLGLIAALAGAGGSAAAGILILMRRTDKLAKLPKPTLIALAGAAALCTFFVMRLWTATMDFKAGPGWAAFVGIGGIVGAGVVMQRIQKIAAFAPGSQFALPPGAAPPGAAPYAAPGANPYAAPGANPYAAPGANPYAAPMTPPGPPLAAPPPAAPAAAAAPVAAQPTHPCPRCQRPLVFVAQYQRWFCESCKQYA